MGVLRTDKWLQQSYDTPVKLCENLVEYFYNVHAKDIYNHLVAHGMYRNPSKNGDQLIQGLQNNKVWETVKVEKENLQKRWNGPDIPIFIFPADSDLLKKTGGKSGLAFHDKLFLFISDQTSKNEIKALLTHEYNHICRLAHSSKKETDYVLLDTIILEGLAENAVRDIVGKKFIAPWINNYSIPELKKIWKKIVYPKRKLSKHNPMHQKILYGLDFFPDMAGYAVGYYLVQTFIEKEHLKDWELLSIPAEKLAQVSSK